MVEADVLRTGGYTAIKDAVRELKARRQEVFVPLEHRPGEAQVDFGQALVKRAEAFASGASPYPMLFCSGLAV